MYRNPTKICNITVLGQILTMFFKESLILDPKNFSPLENFTQKIMFGETGWNFLCNF
jgi:hypothetical protein